MIRKLVIPAAGMGTRMSPFTEVLPKEMLPILDKPVIHYVVSEAYDAGIDDILVVTRSPKTSIINYFTKDVIDSIKGKSGRNLSISFKIADDTKGLGDSIARSEEFVGSDSFLVMLADTFYRNPGGVSVTSQLIDAYSKEKEPLILVESVPPERIKAYGIIAGERLSDNLWVVKDAVEKPEPEKAPSNLAITGSYIFTPEIFDFIKKTKPGRNNEIQITDAIRELCPKSRMLAYKYKGVRYDIGTIDLWIRAFLENAKQDRRFAEYFNR
ncbi:MAG: NTP transferase domain-containing protein [Candidatus Micrarchaeota archaeon]|nr:NTP transferase domain-containing protein [Candidatus Micrarchaeota archaeon]MDE1847434.1 NTP transferase domain-containing protein [Candidatus Micrarchaeota archaeon]MDE1864071.1 NTP transferase domain-containing protein [Candidatus Micrarchaeota archaeon]